MTNKYLEKISSDHMLKGYISPAWQENAIAKDHGKEGLKGFGENYSKHVGGGARANLRGVAEGTAGGLVGGSIGYLAKNPALGAAVGATAGILHGGYRSLRNQAAEAHKKYASDNRYIEKIADFNQMSRVANKMNGGAPKVGGGKPRWFGPDKLEGLRAKPLSLGASQRLDHIAAGGAPLKTQLADNVAKVAAKPAEKGILSRAMSAVGGFAKKNPLTAAGIAAAGAFGAGKMMGSKPDQPSYGGYM